jgi:hypothetical protein
LLSPLWKGIWAFKLSLLLGYSEKNMRCCMAGVNYSQYMIKLNDYLTKNGMEHPYQDVERSQEEYERIFSEFFTKTPYLKMIEAFIQEGQGVDNTAKRLIGFLHRSEMGAHSLVHGARCLGRSASVANAIIHLHDTNTYDPYKANPVAIDLQLLRELFGGEPPDLKTFHFPVWKNLAGAMFEFLEGYGYTPAEIITHMDFPAFFAALPSINDRLEVLPKGSIEWLNYPMAFIKLDPGELVQCHRFLCEIKGNKAVTESWLRARECGVDLTFLGLDTLCEHLGVEDPVQFLEDVSSKEFSTLIPAAADFVTLIVERAGLEGLHRLSAKCIKYLVKNAALSPEQAVHLPAGGQRFAQAALERDLGL